MTEKIDDFGGKIDGARKDLAYARRQGILHIDISSWNQEERDTYIKKDTVFPQPDYQKLVDEGIPKEVVYYIKKVRDSLPVNPFVDRTGDNDRILENKRAFSTLSKEIQEYSQYLSALMSDTATVLPTEVMKYGTRDEAELKLQQKQEELEQCKKEGKELEQRAIQRGQDQYIKTVGEIYERLKDVRTAEDCRQFRNDVWDEVAKHNMSYQIIGTKFDKIACVWNGFGRLSLQEEMKRKQFLFSEEEKMNQNYAIVQYDGQNVQFEKHRLIMQLSARYPVSIWNQPEYLSQSKWEQDKFFVLELAHQKIIGNTFDTEQEAINAIKEYEKAQKAIQSANRKKKLIPPQLVHIERVGEDFREGQSISGEIMKNTFRFYGGQFGKWENQKDRQVNLDMSFDAFMDLAKALNIQNSEISLDEKLGIAWGARGHGSALAHYEPVANVINLTKMKGAGSLGHEWGHALDYFLAKKLDLGTMTATESRNSIVGNIVRAMKSQNGMKTEFYQNAEILDKCFSKSDKGYWHSDVEMFARAFHVYLLDKLKEMGCQNDYLCGNAEMPAVLYQGKSIYTYPRGEERRVINAEFDKLFALLKEREIFHEHDNGKAVPQIHEKLDVKTGKIQKEVPKVKKEPRNRNDRNIIDEGTQLSLFDESEISTIQQTQKEFDAVKMAETAEKLQKGDVIRLAPSMMIDTRTMKPVLVESDYAVVSEINNQEISFRLYKDEELKTLSGIQTISSTSDEHWSLKMASDGFEVVSLVESEAEKKTPVIDEKTKKVIEEAIEELKQELSPKSGEEELEGAVMQEDTNQVQKNISEDSTSTIALPEPVKIICKEIVYDFQSHEKYPEIHAIALQHIRSEYIANQHEEQEEAKQMIARGEISDISEYQGRYLAPFVAENHQEAIRNLTNQYMCNFLDVPNQTIIDVSVSEVDSITEEALKQAITEKTGVKAVHISAYGEANKQEILSLKAYDAVTSMMENKDYQSFLQLKANMQNYSQKNIALIYAQKPDAKAVMSFGAWNKEMNRQILTGSKAIKIWCPQTKVLKTEKAIEKYVQGDDRKYPTQARKEKAIEELKKKLQTDGKVEVMTRFREGNVFDISQTQSRDPEHDKYEQFLRMSKPLDGTPEASERVQKALEIVMQSHNIELSENAMENSENLYQAIFKYSEELLRKSPDSILGIKSPDALEGDVHRLEAEVATYLIMQKLGVDCGEKTTFCMTEILNHQKVSDELIQTGRRAMFEQAFDRGSATSADFSKLFDKAFEKPKIQTKEVRRTESPKLTVEQMLSKGKMTMKDNHTAVITFKNFQNYEQFAERLPDKQDGIDAFERDGKGTVVVRKDSIGIHVEIENQELRISEAERKSAEKHLAIKQKQWEAERA